MIGTGADLIWVLNQYRSAEIRGAGVIMRLSRMADNSTLRSNFTKHLRDEGVHAWMWTRAIEELGGLIEDVDDPYQGRLGAEFGLPRSTVELLALTLVSERRGVEQYEAHLDEPDTPKAVQRALRGILKDEHWHVEWIEEELKDRSKADPTVGDTIERALAADAVAMSDLAAEFARENR